MLQGVKLAKGKRKREKKKKRKKKRGVLDEG